VHGGLAALVNASGPRTSELLTIIPLVINLLPGSLYQRVSIFLAIALCIRMMIGLLWTLKKSGMSGNAAGNPNEHS
jgi:hypothetical protein